MAYSVMASTRLCNDSTSTPTRCRACPEGHRSSLPVPSASREPLSRVLGQGRDGRLEQIQRQEIDELLVVEFALCPELPDLYDDLCKTLQGPSMKRPSSAEHVS